MAFIGKAKLRLEDLNNRPGIAMDGFLSEFTKLNATTAPITAIPTDFKNGTEVFIVPMYQATVANGVINLSTAPIVATGALAITAAAGEEGAVLVLGKVLNQTI